MATFQGQFTALVEVGRVAKVVCDVHLLCEAQVALAVSFFVCRRTGDDGPLYFGLWVEAFFPDVSG